MSYAIHYLPTDPYGRGGEKVGNFDTWQQAEDVRRACINVEHMEVIERPGSAS